MSHRDVLPEERLTLDVTKEGGNLVLVPVKFDGEERYALAMKRRRNGQELLHVLALCLNLGDKGRIVSSLDEEVVCSVLAHRKKNLC